MSRFFPSIWTGLLIFTLGVLAAEVARPLFRQASPPPAVTEAPPYQDTAQGAPQPGEWWAVRPDPGSAWRVGPQGPWASTAASSRLLVLDLVCLYVREVKNGWVRYYQNRMWPDERAPLRLFLTWAHRSSAEACAETRAGTSLRCPPGEDLVTVDDAQQPVCRQP